MTMSDVIRDHSEPACDGPTIPIPTSGHIWVGGHTGAGKSYLGSMLAEHYSRLPNARIYYAATHPRRTTAWVAGIGIDTMFASEEAMINELHCTIHDSLMIPNKEDVFFVFDNVPLNQKVLEKLLRAGRAARIHVTIIGHSAPWGRVPNLCATLFEFPDSRRPGWFTMTSTGRQVEGRVIADQLVDGEIVSGRIVERITVQVNSDDRDQLLRYASSITTQAHDEHQVVDHARVLAAWVEAGVRAGDEDSKRDVRLRMNALYRVHQNLLHAGKLPMDNPEELCGKAACFYVFQGGDPDRVSAHREQVAAGRRAPWLLPD